MKAYVAATAIIFIIVIAVHDHPYLLLFPILVIAFFALIYALGNILDEVFRK